MQKKLFLKFAIIMLAVALVTSACSLFAPKPKPPVPPTGATPPVGIENPEVPANIAQKLAAQSKIKKFNNEEEILEFLENNQSNYYGYGYGGMMRSDMVFEELAMEDTIGLGAPTAKTTTSDVSIPPGASGSDDFSTTNVQVAGVDEADIIKTDGKYIYAVVNNDLFIIDAYPAAGAEVLARVAFDSRPQDIYINDDRLVIYGQDDEIFNKRVGNILPRRGNSYTFMKIFDISDRKNPTQVRDLEFEGSYTNSRMIGDYIYFVTTNYNYYYLADEPVLPLILEDGEKISCLPTSSESARSGPAAGEVGCALPDVYYFDIPYDSYNFTNVAAVNIKDENSEISRDVYIFSSNQNMYVSRNNIYITYTKYISEYELMFEVTLDAVFERLSAGDQEKIIKIQQTDSFILNEQEKMGKIMLILERWGESLTSDEKSKLEDEVEEAMKRKYKNIAEELEKTVIHKIAISNGSLEYKTFGEVTGQVLNQFSMDENNNYFRVATTKSRAWSQFDEENQESYSNIFVLDENMQVVGSVKGLAKGEQIYSARFMQDRAYLVTFKQVDPLFVVDLSSPTSPKVLGELKVPGFSSYLHPYDDNTLIGLGKDTGETEWGGVRTKGVKLSLFDVSNVSAPREIDTYVLGDAGSDSIALSDHKAFLFSKEKNLLVIPISIRESTGGEFDYGKFTFSGATVFTVTKDGFELKGRIDHSDGEQNSESDYWHGYSYYDNTVKRSLYIDNTLYTFSNNYIKMNTIDDLELLKNLELKKEKNNDFQVIN